MYGIGFHNIHWPEFAGQKLKTGCLEVQSEDYLCANNCAQLQTLRQDYPISLHGNGLSLGSAQGVDHNHLARLNNLIQKIDPFLVSDHIAWSMIGITHFNTPLPIPYNEESLKLIVRNIDHVQNFLKREILLENIVNYFTYNASDIAEADFLVAVAKSSGAKILLNITNVYVNAHNFDPMLYLQTIPPEVIGEIHISGHTEENGILMNSNDRPIDIKVLELFARFYTHYSNVPIILEWNSNIAKAKELIKHIKSALEYAQRYSTTSCKRHSI